MNALLAIVFLILRGLRIEILVNPLSNRAL